MNNKYARGKPYVNYEELWLKVRPEGSAETLAEYCERTKTDDERKRDDEMVEAMRHLGMALANNIDAEVFNIINESDPCRYAHRGEESYDGHIRCMDCGALL